MFPLKLPCSVSSSHIASKALMIAPEFLFNLPSPAAESDVPKRPPREAYDSGGFRSHTSCALASLCARVLYSERFMFASLPPHPVPPPTSSGLAHPHSTFPALTPSIAMSATISAEPEVGARDCQITDEPAPNEPVPAKEPLPAPKGKAVQLGSLAANIMPHILNLYNCNATAADYEMYDPKATFEDPLMQAHGVKQIKSAFYSIPKVFKEGKMIEYTVTETESGPNSGEISIDNLQRYKLGSKTIDVVSLIKLQVEDGKVMRHVDMWNKNPLSDRNTVKVPFVGLAAEKLRRGNMLVTHLFMGGKDPKPAS